MHFLRGCGGQTLHVFLYGDNSVHCIRGSGGILSAKSYLTHCDPMDCSLPNSSVHEISQAGILEWVAISISRESSWPRDQTQVSHIADRRFTLWVHCYISQIWVGTLYLWNEWLSYIVTISIFLLWFSCLA